MWTHIRREVIHELVTPWPGPEGTFDDHHVHASQYELIGERRGGSARLPPAARLLPRRWGTAAGSDVPRPRRDGNPPINAHAGLGKVYPSAWPDRRDLDGGLAERDRAETAW